MDVNGSEDVGENAVGAARVTDILEWVRSLLGTAETTSIVGRIETTPACVSFLEELRKLVQERNAWVSKGSEDARLRAKEYSSLRAATKAPFAQRLDPSALAEIDSLATVASELGLPIGNASQHGLSGANCYISAISRAGEKVLAACSRADEREAEAAVASETLLTVANNLKQAHIAAKNAERESRMSESAAQIDREEAARLNAKLDEYDCEVSQLKNEVRASGITTEYTHGAILGVSKHVQNLEDESCKLSQELAKFHDLPPVSGFTITPRNFHGQETTGYKLHCLH